MSSVLRIAARQVSRRGFATSAVARKDLVQDLYLRELKAYKPAPAAKDAHVGAVKQFSLPPSPKAPSLPADLAAELSAYDAAEPVVADKPTASAESVPASEQTGAEAFLEAP
ncbi:hypothetical protein FA13DRAFT_658063 [Coprinellus micaceus]|uniref:ATP synthase complex subunit H-domain-containing protein n=1 Tax=Coprinellus micaceus TaxID=71717 RepID=A0A4Y7S9W7_COPMI|nr:hypothetical protein FA13DRAFT_658063 [Coprinellus micaceus]